MSDLDEQLKMPRGPLIAAACGLLLAAFPLAGRLPLFAIAVFLGALVARALMQQMQWRLPSLPVKLLVLVLGFVGVSVTFGTLRGIEPALGILLILVSLKLLELRTARDFQVLVLLGWFLGLCRLFFEQDLLSWIQTAAVGVLLMGALVAFHSRGGDRWRAARTTGWIVLQAVPLVALLFVFFPRASLGVRFSFNRGMNANVGMADRVEPGGFASLARNDAKAFRVEFPDNNIPVAAQRYWRGGVLWHCDNLTWTRGKRMEQELPDESPGEPRLRHLILLRPHSARWLFALDWPVSGIREATFEAGEFLQSREPVVQPLRYEVFSQPGRNPARLHPTHRRAALQLPDPIPPRAAALAKQWRAAFPDDRDFVDNALRWIHDEKFSYTLEPGDYGPAALEEFLFERRIGFCEHYAAAFGTLMRLGGIPARLVIGYNGGELNEYGGYLIVKQSDAHAWCEVWLAGTGWTRIDPTLAIAPDRISAGLQSLLQSRNETDSGDFSSDTEGGIGWRAPWRRARMMWDNLNYEWDARVLKYDEDEQRTVLTRIGLGDLRGFTFVTGLALAGIVAVALLAILLRIPRRAREDPTQRGYRSFCDALERAGIERELWEGPVHFAERAARELPGEAALIRRAAANYVAVRYSAAPPASTEFLRDVAVLWRRRKQLRRRADSVSG